MSDDFGFYGKGPEGYAHYTQAVEESKKGSGGPGPQGDGSDNSGCVGVLLISLFIILAYYILK